MDDAEFDGLCERLFTLVKEGPGNYAEPLREAEAILRKIDHDDRSTTYVREKVGEAREYFKCWFSTRKWNKNDGGSNCKMFLMQAVQKLNNAVRHSVS